MEGSLPALGILEKHCIIFRGLRLQKQLDSVYQTVMSHKNQDRGDLGFIDQYTSFKGMKEF